jgi:hypothetical protein
MRVVLIIGLVGAVGYWWYDQHRLTESKIERFYADVGDAVGHQDVKRLCTGLAPEFQGTEREVHARGGGVQMVQADKDMICKNYETLFEFKRKYDARQPIGSVLGWDFQVETTSIQIAPDGKSADVHMKSHFNLGNAFIADTWALDHLVIRKGAVLVTSSDGESRVDGILAGMPQ